MRYLLNAVSLRERIDPVLLPAMKALGLDGVRVDGTGATDPYRARQVIDDVQRAGLWPLVIVTSAPQVDWIGASLRDGGGAIEVENEPEARIPYDNYRALYLACKVVADRYGLDCWGGAISNLKAPALAYLAHVVDVIPTVSFHGYANPSEADWAAFGQIVGDRRVACSEFGYHTVPHSPWWQRIFGHDAFVSDGDVARLTHEMWLRLERWGCEFGVAYELNSGPNPANAEDNYGWRPYPAGAFKPVAYTVPR